MRRSRVLLALLLLFDSYARAHDVAASLPRFAILLAVLAFPVGAQESPGEAGRAPLAIPRLSGPVVLDGRVDEEAWASIDPFPMTQYAPSFGAPLSEETEVRVGHDDRYLYISGRMFDSDPGEIRSNTLYRDVFSGDDLLAVVIDSYDDYQTAVWFVTTPAGTRNDRTVSNDAVFSGGGMPMNSDWNAHWDVATTRTDEGWFAEFRIPFSTLGFQARDGEVTMGLISYRFIARRNERQIFPAIEPKWGFLGFAKPSMAQRVVLRDVEPSKPIYVTPYSLGGLRQTPVAPVPDALPEWSTDSDPTTELGVDLRYSPTSNLAIDLTVNTDFAQVEADDQQINLTRFPLFFPEKRQFFQERSSTFQFGTGGFSNRLFHSRRIGLDDGEIVRILGGARAVGRIGGTDFGFIDMQTADHAGRSTENMGVLRLRQEVLNSSSSIGGMVTSRLGSNGDNNLALGIDAVVRPIGDEYVTLKWARTFDEVIDEQSALEASLFQARWQRVRDDGFSYHGEFLRVGDDFVPRLGFQPRRDYRFWGGSMQYKSFRDGESPLVSATADIDASQYTRASDGTVESRSIRPQLTAEFKGGTQITLNSTSAYESVRSSFPIAGTEVEAGDYWFHTGSLKVQLPRSDRVRGDVTATVGSFYDGSRAGLAINPTWNQSRHLELSAGYEINRLSFASRDTETTAHLAKLKAQFAVNTRMSFSALGQYSNVADLTTFNARFRYHFREGTDLWIVYNEGLNTERDLADQPRLPLSAGRTLMVKYTHAFIW